MKAILCYGDSNTWGYVPGTGQRLAPGERWPGVMARELGGEFRVIEEALNGRTTVWEDPIMPGRNGKEFLPVCLESHRPLDLVIVCLGLNDLKRRFSATAYEIARGVGVLIDIVSHSGAGVDGGAPPVLVISPPLLGTLTGYAEQFEGGAERSQKIAPWLRQIAADAGCGFLDITEAVRVSPEDGLHFDADGHAALGRLLASRVRAIE